MNYRKATKRMGLVTAALVFLFTFMAAVPTEAGQFNLKKQLRAAGISMKIVKLDRTDGFVFGLSISGPNQSIILAPGLGRMWLVQIDGSDIIMQRGADGQMQIIQTDPSVSFDYAMCILQALFTFLSNFTACADPACFFTAIMELVANIVACNSVIAPGI